MICFSLNLICQIKLRLKRLTHIELSQKRESWWSLGFESFGTSYLSRPRRLIK